VILQQGSIFRTAQILSKTELIIEGIVPPDTPLGTVQVRIRRGSETSAPFPVEIMSGNPGLYSRNSFGWGPGRIENLRENKGENSTGRPARPSEPVAVLATGVGQIVPDVFVGSQPAKILRIEPSSEKGEERIIIEIPPTAPEGCFVPVYAREPRPEAAPSNVVTVSIRRGSGDCRMPPEFPASLTGATTNGMVMISRASGLSENGSGKWIQDDAVAAFVQTGGATPNAPLLLTPPVGTCTAYAGSSQSPFQMPLTISDGFIEDLGGKGLNVGPALNLTIGATTRVIPSTPAAPGFYRAPLGESDSHRRPLFLNSASVTLSSPGGHDAGPFILKLPITPPFVWTNRGTTMEVDRHRSLTLTWTSGHTDRVRLIVAMNVDPLTTARAMCYCLASAQAGRFTIERDFLANFPATRDIPGQPLNQLIIAAPTLHAPISTTGIGRIQAMSLYGSLRIVRYK
jgi:hypothetical protein